MIDKAVKMMVDCINKGNKILIFGVGGNASTAIHMAAELAGKYEQFETPYACVCLSENPSILTAITNDFGWEHVFSRQIKGLGKKGDVVVAFSISGKGAYLENALSEAKKQGCSVILLNGANNPPTAKYCNEILALGSTDTPRVQEDQLRMVHILCGAVKKALAREIPEPILAS